MSIQEEINSIQKRLAVSLAAIKSFPEDLLPHTVFVEEEADGAPVYTEYKLQEIYADGQGLVYNPKTNKKELINLEAICIDWLVTLWIWYEELVYPQEAILLPVPEITLPQKELFVFLYPSERFERNATDKEIVNDYEMDGEEFPAVEKYTPDEFAAMLNDEAFLNQNMYVRFINY